MKKTKQLILRTGRVASALCLLAGAMILFSPVAAHALNGTWNKTKSGNWSDPNNWLPAGGSGTIADGSGFTANGDPLTGGTDTITLDTPRTIGNLSMNCNGTGRIYSFDDPTGTNTLTLAGATPASVFALNGTLELHVVLAGTAGVRFTGQNSGGFPPIYLYATNAYSGDTQIALEGPLRIGIVDAIPHGSGKGNVVLITTGGHGYGNLDLRGFSITINGLSGAGGTVTCSVVSGASTLTVGDNNATSTFGGVIQDGNGTVALTKIGTGTQTLSGTNTYNGVTTVNAGTLAVNGSITNAVTVNGGTLGGTGTIYGPVTAGAGGSIGAGNSPGTLTLAGGLDLSAGGTNIWELNANSASNPGTDFDVINLSAGPLDVTDATLSIHLIGSVNVNDPFWTSSHSWNIITAAGGSGASKFQTIQVVGGSPAGTFTNANNGTGIVLTYTPGAAPFNPPVPKVTSVVPNHPSPTSVTVNYTNTVSGTNYVLQYRTNVSAGTWTSVITNAAGGTTSSSTDASTTGSTNRYYRIYGKF